MTAAEIIAKLDLRPHPEGGWYRETFASKNGPDRPFGTAIYYLLEAGQNSHWHRVDADEIWHFYAGCPLTLSISETDSGPATDHILGPDLAIGNPQIVVPKGHWQAAKAGQNWCLVGCTVTPGFQFDGFTLAPKDFDIPRA